MARTRTIEFFTGDFADRLDTLETALRLAEKAQRSDAPRTALDVDPVEALGAEYKALKAAALEAATVVTLTPIGRSEWRRLKEKHPPRSGEGVDADTAKDDRAMGVNGDSIEEDLVYACVTDPQFTSRSAFDEWADQLSEGEWKVLVLESWGLVNGARTIPKDHQPSSQTRNDD